MTPAPSWEAFRYTRTEADTAVAVGIGEVPVLATPRVLEAGALPDKEAGVVTERAVGLVLSIPDCTRSGLKASSVTSGRSMRVSGWLEGERGTTAGAAL